MEDLAWTNEKREGDGDIIDMFIRACFIQGLHDNSIKTMVKAKGNVNKPMALSYTRAHVVVSDLETGFQYQPP